VSEKKRLVFIVNSRGELTQAFGTMRERNGRAPVER